MGKGREKRKRRQRKLRKAGVIPPNPDPREPTFKTRQSEDRDPRTRWTNLRVQGGGTVSLDFSGDTVSVEASAGDAEVKLEYPKFTAPVDVDDADAPDKVVGAALGALSDVVAES